MKIEREGGRKKEKEREKEIEREGKVGREGGRDGISPFGSIVLKLKCIYIFKCPAYPGPITSESLQVRPGHLFCLSVCL